MYLEKEIMYLLFEGLKCEIPKYASFTSNNQLEI